MCHWTMGLNNDKTFKVFCINSNYRPRMHRLATVHARDNQATTNDTAYLNKRLFY